MNTKMSRFAQTILIVSILSVLVFVSTAANVKGQIGGDDLVPPQNETVGQSINVVPVVPGGPGFIMISPFEFKPYRPYYEWNYLGSSLYNPSTSTLGYYVAGLTLPHGAKINKVTLYYYDNSTSNLILDLRLESADNSSITMTSLVSSDWANAYRNVSSITIYYPTVDNQNYGYYLLLTLPADVGSNLMLNDVRVDYQYSTSLPCVMN